MEKPIAIQHLSNSGIDYSLQQLVDPRQRAWVEVDSLAIKDNATAIKNSLGKNCSLMAVVKADGYGHGAETVARSALEGGANQLGVATLQEAIQLRQVGLNAPILILGNLISNEELKACLSWNLTPTLSSLREAIICQNLAQSEGSFTSFKVHLKIDTGMTRLGCDLSEAMKLIEDIERFPNLQLDGIYSHLALADIDDALDKNSVTSLQKLKFDNILERLGKRKNSICCHLANSAGALQDPSMHYDMVRIGLALYGYKPTQKTYLDWYLRSALAVRARVTFIRNVPEGTGVSYGHNFVSKRKSRLAVVSIGYADGVPRALSGKIFASIGGKTFPQIGSIAMDQLVLDITESDDVKVGNIVTLLGQDGQILISPNHWSEASHSIPWEILCGFKNRLPRLVI